MQSTASAAVAIFAGASLEDADAGLGPDGFDPAQLSRAGTLYVIVPSDSAGHDGGPVAAAIAEEIYSARKAEHDKGITYEPMAWLIDEAALMPLRSLPGVLAEGRSYGLRVFLCGQSWGAFRDRWGDRGADTLRDAAATSLLWGGLHDDALLSTYEKLGGQQWVKHGSGTDQAGGSWQPRWSIHRIGHLPRRKVLVFTGVAKPRLYRAAYAKRMWACQYVLEQASPPRVQRRLLRVRVALVIVVCILLLICAQTLTLSQDLQHLHL